MEPALPSFGGLLLQVGVSLALVCALAWVVLRFGVARWLGERPTARERLAIEASLSLGPRRRVHLVRALDRLLVVAESERGLHLLTDLGPGSAAQLEPAEAFAQALREAQKNPSSARDGDLEGLG
jgi:flagellar biogenesis protein FliO